MFKYNVGDKVIYKGKECKVIIQEYAKECTEGVVINEHKYYTVEDKYGNKYCCNEGELREMRRIDVLLNSENMLDTLVDIIENSCGNYCIYGDADCEDKSCKEGIKEYLNQTIKKPKVKSNGEPIGVKRREEEFKTSEEHLEDAIKEVNKETNNEFMKTYENIVNQMKDTCIKKNHDYGSSVLSTFDEFGRISYLTRISDKWNRIKTLCNKDEQLVNDESILDSALDMANYLLLWIANETMNKNK